MAWRPTSLKAIAWALSRAGRGHREDPADQLGEFDGEQRGGHAAHRAADDGVQLGDAEVVEQQLLRVRPCRGW